MKTGESFVILRQPEENGRILVAVRAADGGIRPALPEDEQHIAALPSMVEALREIGACDCDTSKCGSECEWKATSCTYAKIANAALKEAGL